jgi:hypothetical protein
MQRTVATKLELSVCFEKCKYFMINAASEIQSVIVFILYVFIIK